MNSDMSNLTRRLKPVLVPLSKKDERKAIKAAVEHLTAEIGNEHDLHYQILGAEIRIEKPPRRGDVPIRLIRVLISDYSNQRNLDISVNHKGKVVQSGSVWASTRFPFR
jgi:hypothetical protein